MSDSIPDLNEEPHQKFWYSLAHGYVCPDFYEGFDDLDGDDNGDVTCLFVKIPFDQDLANSHLIGEKSNKRVIVEEEKVGCVVKKEERGGDDEKREHGGDAEKKAKLVLVNLPPRFSLEYEVALNESWKDEFVIWCPHALDLSDFKGGL